MSYLIVLKWFPRMFVLLVFLRHDVTVILFYMSFPDGLVVTIDISLMSSLIIQWDPPRDFLFSSRQVDFCFKCEE